MFILLHLFASDDQGQANKRQRDSLQLDITPQLRASSSSVFTGGGTFLCSPPRCFPLALQPRASLSPPSHACSTLMSEHLEPLLRNYNPFHDYCLMGFGLLFIFLLLQYCRIVRNCVSPTPPTSPFLPRKEEQVLFFKGSKKSRLSISRT